MQIVFDDDDRMADFDEGVDAVDEFYDVGRVEAGGGFIEEEEGAAGAFDGELFGEFEALGFAAAEGVRGLAEAEVVEADVEQAFEAGLEFLLAAEETERFERGEVEDFGDVAAAVFHVEHFASIAATGALGATHEDVGHELHIDLQIASPLARLAPAACDVEAEVAGSVAAHLGVGLIREERADRIESLDIRDWIRSRRTTDGGLIDEGDVGELAGTEEIGGGGDRGQGTGDRDF
jgi:hypothetical protein